MEVTSENFTEVLEELDEVLKNADFLVIDGEFTGVAKDIRALDTLVQLYEKLKTEVENFLLIQFGLSVFTYDRETNKYKQNSYNFYVFPQTSNFGKHCTFKCVASSISFLANEGFDFNKLFKYGISYHTVEEEAKMYKSLKDKEMKSAQETCDVLVPEKNVSEIENICTKVDNFMKSDAEELSLDKCSCFMKRLINQELKKRWPGKIRIEDSRTDGKTIIIRRAGTKEEEEKRDMEMLEKDKQRIQEAVGLSMLMKKISVSEKLIIGHNMILDICHIVHQFFCVLPEEYVDLKNLIHGLFPRLLDTKLICQSQQFKNIVQSTRLQDLLTTISKSPFSLPQVEGVPNRSYSITETKSHEAGFDAYVTGLCFIALSNFLDNRMEPISSKLLPDSPLYYFLNKIVLPMIKDIPHINLTGNDPNPNRNNVFHVTFPKEWKFDDLQRLFRPYGGIQVFWLSDTSVYIYLLRPNQAEYVKTKLRKGANYKVQTYAEHQAYLARLAKNTAKDSNQKNALEIDEEASSKGIKRKQDEEGWEIATGKRRRQPMDSDNNNQPD